jgi:hypothetical protein
LALSCGAPQGMWCEVVMSARRLLTDSVEQNGGMLGCVSGIVETSGGHHVCSVEQLRKANISGCVGWRFRRRLIQLTHNQLKIRLFQLCFLSSQRILTFLSECDPNPRPAYAFATILPTPNLLTKPVLNCSLLSISPLSIPLSRILSTSRICAALINVRP